MRKRKRETCCQLRTITIDPALDVPEKNSFRDVCFIPVTDQCFTVSGNGTRRICVGLLGTFQHLTANYECAECRARRRDSGDGYVLYVRVRSTFTSIYLFPIIFDDRNCFPPLFIYRIDALYVEKI
jgi:hypothetical protein